MERQFNKAVFSQLLQLMNSTSNPVEKDYISMVLYDYLYKANVNQDLNDEFLINLSEEELGQILENTKNYETNYKNYQYKMLGISFLIIIAIFIIQYVIVDASLIFSLLVSISLGLLDLYYLNQSLFPKYLNKEEKKIKKSISDKTKTLVMKL